MLNEALRYVKLGFAVFPLHANGKKPNGALVPNGVSQATHDENQVRQWWLKCPKSNIGVALGTPSGVVAIDIDKGATEDHVKKLFPRTVTVRSKNGFHLYFKHHPNAKNGPLLLPALDGLPEAESNLRSTGYYVVGVGSEVDAWEYSWHCDAGGELSPNETAYAELPEWALDGTSRVSKAKDSQGKYGPNSRHELFVKTATAMRKKGKPYEEILSEIKRRNLEDCNPPKPDADEEIARAVHWVMKNIDPDPISSSGEELEDAEEKAKESPYQLYCAFVKDTGYKTDTGVFIRYYRQEFYLYRDGKYLTVDDDVVRSEINTWLVNSGRKHRAGTNVVNQVIDVIKTKPVFVDPHLEMPLLISASGFQSATYLLPLRSGLLDMQKFVDDGAIEIKPHTPDFFCRYRLGFDYDPNAKCPTYDKIADAAFSGDKEKRELWEEVMGIHLYQGRPLEHFFVLQGEGANGKSVLVTILTALLGESNVSGVPLQAFQSGRFALSGTYGKLANIVSDQHEITSIDEGMLKQYVSRELMSFERKFKNSFDAKPTCYLTLCTNTMPRFQDKTDGIWRRVVLFEFTNQIPYSEQNTNYKRIEFWEESGELAGIFNLALNGLRRVLKRGGLSRVKTMEESKAAYRRDGDTVATFAEECVKSESTRTPSDQLYSAYRNLCFQSGMKPLSKQNFARRLKIEMTKRGIDCSLSQKNERIDNYSGRVWVGIQLNDHGTHILHNTPESKLFY